MADGPVLWSKPLGGIDCPSHLELELELVGWMTLMESVAFKLKGLIRLVKQV